MNEMTILAIDPGPEQSAWVLWNGRFILSKAIEDNESLISKIHNLMVPVAPNILALEEVRNTYGMPAGISICRTIFWTGRFYEAWQTAVPNSQIILVPRIDVKMHLCKTARARDANVRQVLIDRFGKPGRKNNPGILYGVKKDMWQALALAVYIYDQWLAKALEVKNASK